MKWQLFLPMVFLCNNIRAQRQYDITAIQQQTVFYPDKIYMVCRGTKSKSSLIAHQFNIADTNITHCAIGFYKKGNLLLYNVTDVAGPGKSALVLDSLASFIASPDVYYFSIWECNSSISEINKLENICRKYTARKIYFDAAFKISKDDTLYCAEFCAAVLNQLHRPGLHFNPRTITLNNSLYKMVLERDQFCYFPVDFFQRSKSFKKIFSYRLSH